MSDPVGAAAAALFDVCVRKRNQVTLICVKIWNGDSEPSVRSWVALLHVPKTFNWWGFQWRRVGPAVWRWVRRWMDGHRIEMNRLGEADGSLGADMRVISWTRPLGAAAQREFFFSHESGAGIDDGRALVCPFIKGPIYNSLFFIPKRKSLDGSSTF